MGRCKINIVTRIDVFRLLNWILMLRVRFKGTWNTVFMLGDLFVSHLKQFW